MINYPVRGQKPYQPAASDSSVDTGSPGGGRPLVRINTEPLPTTSASAQSAAKAKSATIVPGSAEGKKKPLPAVTTVQGTNGSSENKDSPEYKKKKALENGPVLELDQGNHEAYGMQESLFTALKDLFESIIAHSSKMGTVKPTRFLEILRQGNDMFNGQQHQDAHEFLNYVLNEVIENVEEHQKSLQLNGEIPAKVEPVSSASSVSNCSGSVTGWMHELFQGQLTSETKCLTCENVSRRDEHFLDLSIDVEKNSSVTSCLRAFSASEMLCERNKFHCDSCGGLQEAEKRMKIKRLPKVLALHLKRFKYMEQTGRFEKLHYRVLYPYHLRLFNTTDDAEDPDRLYELYAVVVHIGGGPYHGHYVAIIKTEDKGWLLFDDELVEPVDKSYVRNFFGERTGSPGVASAYLLFYQETTVEAMQREMWAEEPNAPAYPVSTPLATPMNTPADPFLKVNGHTHTPLTPTEETLPIDHAVTNPLPSSAHVQDHTKTPAAAAAEHPPIKSKKEKKAKKESDGSETEPRGSISRFRNTSRSLRQPPKWLGGKGEKDKEKEKEKSLPPPLPALVIDDTGAVISPIGSPVAPPMRRVDTMPMDWKAKEPETSPKKDALPSVLSPTATRDPSPLRKKEREKERKREKEREKAEKAEREKAEKAAEKAAEKEREREKEREKEKGKENGKEKTGQKRGLHHHRPSLFGLRKKAQTALGAGE